MIYIIYITKFRETNFSLHPTQLKFLKSTYTNKYIILFFFYNFYLFIFLFFDLLVWHEFYYFLFCYGLCYNSIEHKILDISWFAVRQVSVDWQLSINIIYNTMLISVNRSSSTLKLVQSLCQVTKPAIFKSVKVIAA